MRLKKLISGVLAGLTAISSIPFSSVGVIALAADEEKDIWNGTTDTSWYYSEEKEFHISTPEELAGLARLVNDGKKMSGQTFVLDNDIYMNDVSKYEKWESVAPTNSWAPIGTRDTYCFSGIFDGSGFSIEGLYISGSYYQYSGFFGYTTESSEISNVNMTYEYIDGTYSYNSFAGGITAYSKGKIDNCTFSGTVTSSNDYAGGIAGCSSAEISNCTNNGTITSYYYGGGIAGYSSVEINNCTNSGDVTSSYYYGGGIAGYSSAEISNCTNNGTISSYCGGGIAGHSDAEISNCTNNGSITSSNNSNSYGGGIAGYSNATISNCTNNESVSSSSYTSYGGGIAGYSKAEISNCTNSGDVTSSSSSSSYGGGIAGYSSANMNNCTNNGTVTSSSHRSKSYAGGIVGESYCSFGAKEIIISNVYNTGKVTAKYYEGGIVGYANLDNSSYKLTVNNAYNIGKVSSAILGGSKYSNGFTIINSSYLIGQSKQGCIGYTDDEGIVAKSKEEMQTKEFAESLGDAFVYVEGDYPKLAWEINNIEEPTEITSETTSEDTSNMENTTDISETESISTDITESPFESETTTIEKPTTTVTTKTNIEISVGDINDDGAIDSKDAVLVLKYYAESLTGSTTTSISPEKGDVNGDGKIDSKDAVKILKYYAQIMVGLNIDIKDV